MTRMKNYTKHIACLESLWNNDLDQVLNVAPILELVAKLYNVKTSRLTCNTVPELSFNLNMLRQNRAYRILYLAFHGSPGAISLANEESVSLEQLAEMMDTGFSGWIVHFCTCQTIHVNEQRLESFMRATDTGIIAGYTTNAAWIESSALDLLLLGHAQNYRNMASLRNMLLSRYGDLVTATGLQLYLKADFA
jgi:uncharacterized protein DUF6642